MEGISYRVSLLNGTGDPGGGPGGGTGQVEIRDEGGIVGRASVLNFVGVDVRAQINADGTATIYVPAPNLASPFNSNSGSTDARVGSIGTDARLLGRGLATGDWNPVALISGGAIGGQLTRAVTPVKTWSLTMPGAFAVPLEPSRVVLELRNQIATIIHTTQATATGNKTAELGPLRLDLTNYEPDAFQFKMRATATIKADLLTGVSGRFILRFRHELVSGAVLGIYEQELFYDRNSPTVSLTGAVLYNIQVPVYKWLSGVRYFTIGTQVKVDASGLDYTTTDSWPADGNLLELAGGELGLPVVVEKGPQLSSWSNTAGSANAAYSKSNWTIVQTGLYARGGLKVAARLFDYGPQPFKDSNTRQILLDTLVDDSNRYIERFNSEARRLNLTFTPWDSTASLTLAPALQVVGGTLRRPENVDYGTYEPVGPNYIGLAAGAGTLRYLREYLTSGGTKSNGVFFVPGLTNAQLSAGVVTLEISLDGDVWFSLNAGYNPGAGPLQNGFGCRVETGSFAPDLNNRVKFTLGTLFTDSVYLRVSATSAGGAVVLHECTLETWA